MLTSRRREPELRGQTFPSPEMRTNSLILSSFFISSIVWAFIKSVADALFVSMFFSSKLYLVRRQKRANFDKIVAASARSQSVLI